MLKMPYFMTNEDWYRYDKKQEKCVLTDKAPVEAIESYKQYLKDYELASNGYVGTGEEEEAASLFGF